MIKKHLGLELKKELSRWVVSQWSYKCINL